MARTILLSNGQMHVGLNDFAQVHDFYYPYVGLENHSASKRLRHRIGVYVDNQLSWIDDGSWIIDCDYLGDVLVSKITAINTTLSIRLEFDDCVDSEKNAFIRNVHIVNMSDDERHIKLYMHQVFVISDSHQSDTVQYLPDERVILHYKGHRAFVVNAVHADGRTFDDYSVGLFGIEDRDGTFRDAEDGELSKNGVEHGKVDSVLGLYMTIRPQSSHRIYYWISAGKSAQTALKTSNEIKLDGVLHRLLMTSNWWQKWIRPTRDMAKRLPEKYQQAFIRSALIIKASTDKRGAVMASTDTTMLNYSRDSYAYCWPRDAVYVLWPLLRIGYTEELINFFGFCKRVMHEDGYLAHKYQADGAVGSSWHPYTHYGSVNSPPIQTDETAGVLFLFGQYYRMHKDKDLLKSYYSGLVRPMANFLSGFIGHDKLPLPSYDLWEEKYLTTTYSTALTHSALMEAVFLAEIVDDKDSMIRWSAVAEDMYNARDIFYNEENKYFYKGYIRENDNTHFDGTIDSSSLFGVFMYGYFDMNDKRVRQSYETLRQELMIDDTAVARYYNDNYRRETDGIGNPWPVTSLWFAQYALDTGDKDQAEKIFDWVMTLTEDSNMLAEQYLPNTKKPRSVQPLTWSHAELMSALLDTITEQSNNGS